MSRVRLIQAQSNINCTRAFCLATSTGDEKGNGNISRGNKGADEMELSRIESRILAEQLFLTFSVFVNKHESTCCFYSCP